MSLHFLYLTSCCVLNNSIDSLLVIWIPIEIECYISPHLKGVTHGIEHSNWHGPGSTFTWKQNSLKSTHFASFFVSLNIFVFWSKWRKCTKLFQIKKAEENIMLLSLCKINLNKGNKLIAHMVRIDLNIHNKKDISWTLSYPTSEKNVFIQVIFQYNSVQSELKS